MRYLVVTNDHNRRERDRLEMDPLTENLKIPLANTTDTYDINEKL